MDTPSFESSRSPSLRFENLTCNGKKLNEDNFNTGEDDSIHMQIYNAVKDLSVLKKGYDLRFALILMTTAFFVMLGAFLGAIVFSLYVLKNHIIDPKGLISSPGTPSHITQKYEYIGLSDLNSLPLTQLEDMHSLVLQWGQSGSGRDRQFFYNILSAYRDGFTNTTTLHLSKQHSLVATNENAVLLDQNSNELGVLDFASGHLALGDGGSSNSSGVTNMDSLLSPSSSPSNNRRLGKLGDKLDGKLEKLLTKSRFNDRVPGGPPADMFDAYCRYGCGGMAVTFPYYYRPHFGYGYPLVGTQSQFPQGYGGYAGAPIMREAHEQYMASTRGQAGAIPLDESY